MLILLEQSILYLNLVVWYVFYMDRSCWGIHYTYTDEDNSFLDMYCFDLSEAKLLQIKTYMLSF